MNFLEIIEDLKTLNKEFVLNKTYGKINLEINYQNGEYVCDNLTATKSKKRI